jgi:hypothetical protein
LWKPEAAFWHAWLRALVFGFMVAVLWTAWPVLAPMVSSAFWRRYECKVQEVTIKRPPGPSCGLDNSVVLEVKYSFITSQGANTGNRLHVLNAQEIGDPRAMEELARAFQEKEVVHCYANRWNPADSALSRDFDLGKIGFGIWCEWYCNKQEIVLTGLGGFLLAMLCQLKSGKGDTNSKNFTPI